MSATPPSPNGSFNGIAQSILDAFHGKQEDQPRPSALDLFIWQRGSRIHGGGIRGMKLGFGIAGGVNLGFGVIFLALTSKQPGFIVPAAIMGSIGAGFLIATAFLFAKYKNRDNEVRLTKEGGQLLFKLVNHVGYMNPYQYSTHKYGSAWHKIWGIKTASNILSKQGFEILETAAGQHLRIHAQLELDSHAGKKLSRSSGAIRLATEETMITLINQVALLEHHPESLGSIGDVAKKEIAKLTELADRVEQSVTGEDSLLGMHRGGSTIDGVLENLRMEQEALDEIRYSQREPKQEERF